MALAERASASFVGRCVQRFLSMAGFDRCIVLSSQAFTALIPLLILLSTLAPSGDESFISDRLVEKFGLTGDSAAAVRQLFEIPDTDTSTVSAFSAALLVVSGVSFTRRLQRMYRAAWGEEKAGVRSNVFAALGLGVFLVEALVLYGVRALVRNLPLDWLLALPLSAITGTVLWTSIPFLLLNREVHWRRLLVGGSVTGVATAVYGVATAIYMPELISRYTEDFGLFGITIAIIGWLLVVSAIVVASSAVGAEFDASRVAWALRIKAKYRLLDPQAGPQPDPDPDLPAGLSRSDLVLLVRVLVNCAVLASAVWVATAVVPGIDVDGGLLTYLWVSLLLGVVNAVLGPILRLAALPLTVVTLGLFALVVNALLLATTAILSSDLAVGGLGTALLGAAVMAAVTTVLELVLRPTRLVT